VRAAATDRRDDLERGSAFATHPAIIDAIVERIMVQVEQESLEALDEVAAKRGVSRSAVVRDFLCGALAEERRKSELAHVVNVLGRFPTDDDVVVPALARRSAWPQ
jgi:hypothetical protein